MANSEVKPQEIRQLGIGILVSAAHRLAKKAKVTAAPWTREDVTRECLEP